MVERDERGRALPGNTLALQHGGFSRQVEAGALPEQAEAVAAAAERRAAIVADLGGTDALSALALSQIDTFVRLEVVADFLWTRLQEAGPLTAKGRQRAALTAWLGVVDRLQRLANMLGLERKARRVPDALSW